MTGITHGAVRLGKTPAVLSAGLVALAGAVSNRFQRSLAVRFAEQRALIERTGVAGMI